MNQGTAMPQVSVVLPVYNGEAYLAQALDSILAQSFADFELIAFDDGSTDGSLRLLRDYEARDRRVRVFTRENRGLVATLNESIDLARGAWIARMDQDDIALPHRFERQLEWLGQTSADICGSWVRRFGMADRRTVKLRESDAAIRMEMMFRSPFAHPSVMMRTALAKGLRYDPACETAEDYDLWERAAEAGWKMTNVQEVLLSYRVHAAQISTSSSVRQQQVEDGIRRRYWHFVCRSLQPQRIDDVLKIFGPAAAAIDMDAVDEVFAMLLRQSRGEAREAVCGHVNRLYLMVAAVCPDIVARWNALHREFGCGAGALARGRLRLFRLLRISPDGSLFRLLKRLYAWRSLR
ncbi:MAG TPA: glycosyltransferase [Sideroxyarcus sp.]|nr:glycosyltransferase [Sideroxyarcus sp.]